MKARGVFVCRAEGLEDGVVDDVSIVEASPAIDVDLSRRQNLSARIDGRLTVVPKIIAIAFKASSYL
jgi:hypothetical protein